MSKSKYWRQVIVIEVLTDSQKEPEWGSLEEVLEEITKGDSSGMWETLISEEVDSQVMADRAIFHQTDPEFFGIIVDDKGKVLKTDAYGEGG